MRSSICFGFDSLCSPRTGRWWRCSRIRFRSFAFSVRPAKGSSRPDKCRRPVPEHRTCPRAGDPIVQLMEYLAGRGEIDYEHLFVDGTKLEARANRYSFVWRKSVEKRLAIQTVYHLQQPHAPKTRYGCMVRRGRTLQQPHVPGVVSARFLQLPAGIRLVHCSKHHYPE